MREEAQQHAMVFFLAGQALLGAISSAMSSEDDLWISVLAAAAGSQAAGAGSAETSHGGRAQRSRRNVDRGACSWFSDYLSPSPVYNAAHFRRRFRVPHPLYLRIESDLLRNFPEDFKQKCDATGRPGHTAWQTILVALRRLATGRSLDDLDDAARMSEESTRQACRIFVKRLLEFYGGHYLNRRPTKTEILAIEAKYADAGFRGCIGAVDCMEHIWKNCPKQLKGQFKNPKDEKLAVISIEAWCDRDLYCWNWFSGRAGTNNDITVASSSPLFNDILEGEWDPCFEYVLEGEKRQVPYFLVDGIYPRWTIFAKPYHYPTNVMETTYTKRQEAVRKDIE
jgi:hypothetical protein